MAGAGSCSSWRRTVILTPLSSTVSSPTSDVSTKSISSRMRAASTVPGRHRQGGRHGRGCGSRRAAVRRPCRTAPRAGDRLAGGDTVGPQLLQVRSSGRGRSPACAAASGATSCGACRIRSEVTRISSETSAQRRAESTSVTAWPARMPPIGWASGGMPQSRRTCRNSSSTSSSRSARPASVAARPDRTPCPPAGGPGRCEEASRGGIGSAGICDVT